MAASFILNIIYVILDAQVFRKLLENKRKNAW